MLRTGSKLAIAFCVCAGVFAGVCIYSGLSFIECIGLAKDSFKLGQEEEQREQVYQSLA